MRKLPKGTHKVKKKLADGTEEFYVYAWRGGKRLFSDPQSDDFIIEYAAALQSRKTVEGDTLYDLCGQYLDSPKHKRLSKGTRRYRKAACQRIQDSLGGLTVNALMEVGVKEVFVGWRDSFSNTPKAADMNMETLRVILAYALERGKIEINYAKGISNLYRNDRADVIWKESEIETLKEVGTPALSRAVDFARLTGLRLGDCISITWNADKGDRLIWLTSKTQKYVKIPIIAELRELLDSFPRNAETILENSFGKSWKPPALQNAMQRAKRKCGIDKRFHDLRGTYATMLIRKGVSDERVADVMGWSKARISEIRTVYVDDNAIIDDIIRQIDVNQNVNCKPKDV